MSVIEIPGAELFVLQGLGNYNRRPDVAERDTYLLAKLLPTTDSPKLCAMIYDAVTGELGQPGIGYDPVALFRCGQKHFAALHPLLVEAEKDGFQAAKDAGWY